MVYVYGCVHTSACVLTRVSYLTSMYLVFSIYKMGTISNSNRTKLMKRLNKMVHVKCLIGNKHTKVKIPNRNYYPQNGDAGSKLFN